MLNRCDGLIKSKKDLDKKDCNLYSLEDGDEALVTKYRGGGGRENNDNGFVTLNKLWKTPGKYHFRVMKPGFKQLSGNRGEIVHETCNEGDDELEVEFAVNEGEISHGKAGRKAHK